MEGKQQTINLNTLSLEQLNMLKQQLEEELNLLGNSYQQLKIAAQRYLESKENLGALTPENEGQLVHTDSVLIDIGTGYYVKKSIKDAKDYTDRKVKLVNEQADKVQQAITNKRRNLEGIVIFMQQKIYQYEQAQRGNITNQ